MSSFGNVSNDFNSYLKTAALDKVIKSSELNKLKEIAGTDDEKAIVELLSKDKTNIDFKIQDGTSISSYSLGIDLDETVSETIKSHKDDAGPLEIRKWQGYTRENTDNFKTALQVNNGHVLDGGPANLLTGNIFSMTTSDFQNLIGEKNGSGKFGARTFFLMQEHLAKQVNNVNSLDDCQKLSEQLKDLGDYLPGIKNNFRHKELELTLKYKTANFIHDEINQAKDPEQCSKIREKLDNLKDSVPDHSRLTDLLNDKTREIFNPLIHRAENLGDCDTLREKLNKLAAIIPEAMFKSLEGNLNSKTSLFLNDNIRNATGLNECIALKEKLKSFEKHLNPDTFKLIKSDLIRKSIKALDQSINETKGLIDCNVIKEKLKLFKGFIPDPTIKLLEASLETKVRKFELYGTGGVNGIKPEDIRQGTTNDCYYLSALASVAFQRPGDIAKMITASEDGRYYTVKFPGAKYPVTVSKPTEAELANYSQKGSGGSTWAPVLEKAYAAYINKESGFAYKDSRDAIDGGGLLSTGINIVTGHSTDTDILALTKDSTIRNKIRETLNDKRIITLSSFLKGSREKEIDKNHVYSVLSFDPKNDTVTIKNPYGKGNEAKGLKYKDGKDDGIYTITIAELNKYFSLIAYEEKD